jgi:hypothetical protein
MAKFPIPENCSAYVPMILKEFCSSTKINRLVMKTFQGNSSTWYSVGVPPFLSNFYTVKPT